jgi:hypothetical protein
MSWHDGSTHTSGDMGDVFEAEAGGLSWGMICLCGEEMEPNWNGSLWWCSSCDSYEALSDSEKMSFENDEEGEANDDRLAR